MLFLNKLNLRYNDPYLSMIDLLYLSQTVKSDFNKLPKEEQERILAEREQREENRRIAACIQAGKCPTCLSNLIRGSKDKSDGYKRIWHCKKCDLDFRK